MKHSRFITKIVLTISISAILGSALISCTSTKKEVPCEATDREIVQMAQDSFASGHTEDALYYYETLLMRYGNKLSVYVEGKYEIAHIYLKQKRYTEAKDIYMEILDIYQNTSYGELPGSYRKLTQNDLAKIPANKLTASSDQE